MEGKIAIVILAVAAFLSGILLLARHCMIKLVDKRISEYQGSTMEKHLEEVQNMYRQIRSWRHDFHNHIQTMKAHLAMGNLEALDAYFNELDEDLTKVDTVMKTGNIMVDAILNSKLSLAKASRIAVDAKAIVPKDLPMPELDLSLVIGNLLDNAIEACKKIEDEQKRFIRVYVDILKGQLYIYVMNSSDGKLKKIGRLYLSTKEDTTYHGFGLRKIDQVVEKYHGYLERQDEPGVFATEIMLPL